MTENDSILKSKADDYLQEFSVQTKEKWISLLIDHIITTRSIPSDIFLDKIYEEFCVIYKLKDLKENKSQIELHPTRIIKDLTVNDKFELKSLIHENGVNALLDGASISFHPKLTVIYGKNGSGKSGFVRILKKVSGSRTQEDIWQNINNSTRKNECRVKISFNSGTDKIYSWNGQSNISPFNRMSIFDGKCIPIYLTKGLDFSYQPYGFELFQILSSSLVFLHQKLTDEIRQREEDKPSIHNIFDSQTTIGKFIENIDSFTKIKELDDLPKWDQAAKTKLLENVKESKGLQNLDQQFEILQTRLDKVSTLLEKIEEIKEWTSSENINNYSQLIKKFNTSKKKFTEKKGKTLEDYKIAEMESDEWEKFIEAGESYTDITEGEKYPCEKDNCIYCHQKLSKNAVKLIKLYRELFQEEESDDFEKAEKELDKMLSSLEGVSFKEDFHYENKDFTKVITKKVIDSAFDMMEKADSLIQRVIVQIKTKDASKIQSLKLDNLISSIEKAKEKIEIEIRELREAQKNLDRRSRELNFTAIELLDIQKFSKQRKLIENYIEAEEWIIKANTFSSKLNTKIITDLGKKAWKELVSDSFKLQFNNELKSLNAPNVSLEFRGEYGSQMREKSLSGFNQIDQFLSEGEQKAVALADFFTELSIKNGMSPVIFDDPATSFDHERKEKIAKRISEESKLKQVVVFTHDLMFANYLHEQVENTDGNLDINRGSFHNIERSTDNSGLVSENDYAGSIRFGVQIQKIEEKLSYISNLTGEAKREEIKNAYSKLRKAVEKAVEEKIFGKVIVRWSDQIQMHNVSKATLNKPNLEKAKELHELFSRYIEAHNQSDEMIQHAMPDNVETLKDDIKKVKDLAL